MAIRLICPRCGQQLTVSEAAPVKLTCPSCLGPIDNPTAAGAARRPVPVIPIERQTSFDRTAGTIAMAVAAAVVLLGMLVVTTGIGSTSMGSLLLWLTIIALIGGSIYLGVRGGPEAAQTAEWRGPVPPPLPTGQGPPVLSYGVRRYQAQPRVNWGAFSGGFFGAIGVCAAGFFLLAGTVDYKPKEHHGLFLLLVIAAVVATIVAGAVLSRRPGWIGIGRGVAVGLCLGMLALGPCGFCYLLTL